MPTNWHYPNDLVNDLQEVNLPERVKEEVLATAWEYTRCVIPHYTNWDRYISFTRAMVICIIAEFRGDLVDVGIGDHFAGYDLGAMLAILFEGTPH